ncbi:MAG TPA: AI-2E family transporter [Flavipsychrobacter sp.]|nr:AI-2E family transporter [Flavipsychrobacter sp.]
MCVIANAFHLYYFAPVNATINTTLKYLLLILVGSLLLFFGKALFIPMFFGLLVAIVVYPVCKRMEEKGMSRSFSIGVLLSIVTVTGAALLFLLFVQIQMFQKDVPEISAKLKPLLNSFQLWIDTKFSITISTQDEWLHASFQNVFNNAGAILSRTISNTIATLFMFFMIPIFTALFLYNRGSFVRALQAIAGNKHKNQLQTILSEVVTTYFNYIKGMMAVYIIVGVLNSLGLLALGIRHAILFGMLTAVMTIIPYVGIIISALLPISVAFVTKDSAWYPIGVIGVFVVVQYLEANVIFPKVVGMQLNVSTWATLVAILLGGIIWGMSGMVLFIPFVAILKIVTDHVESLKPLNILLSR